MEYRIKFDTWFSIKTTVADCSERKQSKEKQLVFVLICYKQKFKNLKSKFRIDQLEKDEFQKSIKEEQKQILNIFKSLHELKVYTPDELLNITALLYKFYRDKSQYNISKDFLLSYFEAIQNNSL